jgi:hypothetical protein
MIADYRENGVDMHNEFIAPHTDDYERAVCGLADAMQRQGLKVSCITVCPGAKSFADLRRMEDEGIRPGNVYIPYIFDLEGDCG